MAKKAKTQQPRQEEIFSSPGWRFFVAIVGGGFINMEITNGRSFFVTLFVYLLPFIGESVAHSYKNIEDHRLRGWYVAQTVLFVIWFLVALFGIMGAYTVLIVHQERFIEFTSHMGFAIGRRFDLYWLFGPALVSIIGILGLTWWLRPKSLTSSHTSGNNNLRGGMRS